MSTTIPAPRQHGSILAPAPATSPNGHASQELAAELALLRDRFAAYERLDTQLDEMVSGLTELLRGAADLRRRTNRDIKAAFARCEALVASDHAQHRTLLAEIVTDLDETRQRAATLTRTVAGLQSQLERLTGLLPSRTAPRNESSGEQGGAAIRTYALSIHDVPTVAAALTLQRIVTAIPSVTAIHAREFAAGIFRLDIEVADRFSPTDIQLHTANTLHVIEATSDRLVFRCRVPVTT